MGNRIVPKLGQLLILILFAAAAVTVAAEDKLLIGHKERLEPVQGENYVRHRCLTPPASEKILLPLERDKPWSLPKTALDNGFLDTINILVLRFDFQFEDVDDPNTTGRGRMNLSELPTDADVMAYYDSVGHFIDPPPHDSLYFDAHLRALRLYWETVSDGKITLTWDIYPPLIDSVYELPQPMNHYGRCDFDDVIPGLEAYFIDCIRLADSVSPEIDFSRYESIFLFHAGSDRQNDIGFPTTCSDLFTGFITFGDSLSVDSDSNFVRTALIMPETSNQDNRATALNAVMAHEFGHQLGLVDLYSTYSFMSMLGDFALMDNNGFGTGIDFGFDAGNVFGAIPVYPTAWSRAFLGFIDVVDYRQGTDIRIVAAEMISEGIKAARVPITENEYYLIENRIVDLDGKDAAARADEATSVILGPSDLQREFNREYDFLLPGSGMLVYHVDERVAALDYDYDGRSNFADNQLQWSYDIFGNRVDQFITLVEADGFVNFGGIYRAGYGEEDDMFRDDRNHSFTPNTNPAAVDNSGNNTHIYITDITRATDQTGDSPSLMDSVMLFDLEIDRMVRGFPVRVGYPVFGLSPISDDLDGDGNPEIIFASNNLLSVVTADGRNFLRDYTGCETCPTYDDTAYASVNIGTAHVVPLYAQTAGTITSGPVTGVFTDAAGERFVTVGYGADGTGWVELYSLRDGNEDGLADLAYGQDSSFFSTIGTPVAMTFGDLLYVVTDSGFVYLKSSLEEPPIGVSRIFNTDIETYKTCRYDDALVITVVGDDFTTLCWYHQSGGFTVNLDDVYTLGPILCDVDLDGRAEAVLATEGGRVTLVTLDPVFGAAESGIMLDRTFNFSFATDPVAGDVDLDGYPDIIIGGANAIYAFNHQLTLKTSFPVEVNDRFPDDVAIASPIVADLDGTAMPEIVISTVVGNVYSFGLELSPGFPLSAGEVTAGAPVFVNDTIGGLLGYLGADGWFYLWHVNEDAATNFWPMNGADPAATYFFDVQKLPELKEYADRLPGEKYYNYPNPVVDGVTVIRYFLGQQADAVELNIYDMSGREIERLDGPTDGGVDNEVVWECGNVTPGVYRCLIRVDFGGSEETVFTDIAIIR